MKRILLWIVLLTLSSGLSSGNQPPTCDFKNQTLFPLRLSIGLSVIQGKTFTVNVNGDQASGQANQKWGESFDGPIQIVHLKTNQACSIPEGGIYTKDGFYLSQNEKFLMIYEYSGSSGNLLFYDTATCEKYAAIDVSGKWSIRNNKIFYDGMCEDGVCDKEACTCRPAQVYTLTDSCRPIFSEKESFKRTEKLYGIGFREKSLVQHPHSKKAKILKR